MHIMSDTHIDLEMSGVDGHTTVNNPNLIHRAIVYETVTASVYVYIKTKYTRVCAYSMWEFLQNTYAHIIIIILIIYAAHCLEQKTNGLTKANVLKKV